MHVAVPDVAIAHHPGHGARQPLSHHSDADREVKSCHVRLSPQSPVVEDTQGQGDVVFVAVAILEQRLCDPLPELPDLSLRSKRD